MPLRKIHIVDLNDSLRIIESTELENGCVKIRQYDEDGEYYIDRVPAIIRETFLVITHGEFIRNYDDTSKLNAYRMSSGDMSIDGLAYAYSATIVEVEGEHRLNESDNIYSISGIRRTNFNMYSYHVNEPEKKYMEGRLEYEIFESLNLNKILGKYLTKSDIRDSKIDDILS